ncbi:MAG: cell division ATP-binding protein FtsE [Desulfurivibrionaceae bacterium]|nr:cell division ATP-binding protein FtsE [Desulfobulbales bacterium]MDT8335653.1 cell division ATP-binding protein FtsE [Desulfurivibrionaceae bacterium]
MIKSFSDDLPIVDIVKATKVYPPDIIAVQNVSLAVGKGELVFLTGMSGAGKTTLLKMVCCIEQPTKGVIEVAGHDLSRIRQTEIQKLRRQIGVVYQDFKILPKQTVYENIAIPMEVMYRSPKEIRKRVDQLLETLRITHKRNIQTAKLSRGEQQRVAIARAAANEPPLILADEPTGNLDSEVSGYVMELFKQLNNAGSTIIIATHDESIYRKSRHRKVELQHGLFSGHVGHRQLPLINA